MGPLVVASIEFRRIFASIAVGGLTLLCQCTVFFDVNGLVDTGPATSGLDATTDAGGDALANDAAADNGSDIPEGGATTDDGADALPSDATDDDASPALLDAPADVDGAQIALDAGADSARPDAADGASIDAPAVDAADSAVVDTGTVDTGPDSGDINTGLVAYYPFNETSGTMSADVSGNGHAATMSGATFASGFVGNAATMNGSNQYVILPNGIVNGLTSFSIAAWVKLSPTWSRVFDFGTGTTSYMFLTPPLGAGTRFGITTSGPNGEQRIQTNLPSTGAWQHVCVTLTGNVGTLYLGGVALLQNASMTLNPTSLGQTTQDWIGRSQFPADQYSNGQIDNFRIYNRALAASEVMRLFQGKL